MALSVAFLSHIQDKPIQRQFSGQNELHILSSSESGQCTIPSQTCSSGIHLFFPHSKECFGHGLAEINDVDMIMKKDKLNKMIKLLIL